MAKILLVNPIIRDDDKPKHVPFGLAQLAAIINKADHSLQVFDCNAWRPSEQQITNVLKAEAWDVIGIGGLVTTYGFIKSFLKKARESCPHSKLIVGGGVITPIPHEILKFCPEIDVGVIGEGYKTILNILDHIDAKAEKWDSIDGIIWRDKSGEVILNNLQELLNDLDSLPFPAWEYFPLEIYFKNSSLLLSEEAMLSQRRLEFCCSYGCPYKCKYCFHLGLSGELSFVRQEDGRGHINITRNRKVRFHSPEYVVELAVYARKKFEVDFLSFLDENFVALDKITKGKWMNTFEKLWLANDLQPECLRNNIPHDPYQCKGIHWGTSCHAALADEILLERLRKLGCSHLDFGFESFSNEVLKEAGKCATKKMNINALKASMRAGIRAIPNQIIGFPNETIDSILESIEVWKELGIKSFPFLATPYPGSEWFDSNRENIMQQYDNNLEAFLLDLGDATSITAVIAKNFTAVELLGLRRLMVNLDSTRILAHQDKQYAPKN